MKSIENLSREDFQKLTIRFRSVSSSFLSTSRNDFYRKLQKLLHIIDSTEIISNFISQHNITNYDFSELKDRNDFVTFNLPVDDSDEIAYIYQLIKYIAENEPDITILTFRYGKRQQSNQIQSFNNQVIKPLIDHINLYFTELKIDLGFQNNHSTTNYTFHKDFRGQINQASNNSTIEAHQHYQESDIQELKELSSDFLNALTSSQEIAKDEKIELLELLEVTIQSIENEEPKKSIIQIGMDKIKGVVDNVDTATKVFVIGTQLYTFLSTFLQ